MPNLQYYFMKKLTTPARSTEKPESETSGPGAEGSAVASSLEEDEDVSVSEIQDMLEDSSLNGASVRIARLAPGADDFAYCATISVKAFEFERVKTMYGGGDYQITLLDSNGKYVKRRKFSVDPRIKGQLDKTGTDSPEADRPGDPMSGSLKEILSMQKDSTNLLMTMMMENNKSQIAIMTAALTGKGSSGGGLDVKDVIALLPLLTGKDKSEKFGPRELMEFYREMKALSADDGKESDSPILGKIVEALPQIAARFGGAMRAGPVVAAAPEHRPAAAAPAAIQMHETDLERVLKLTINGARRNSDPGLYADMILDLIDDTNSDQIRNVLTQEGWFGLLFPDAPDAPALMPWMESLRTLILKTLDESANEPANEGNGVSQEHEPAGGGDPARLPGNENS